MKKNQKINIAIDISPTQNKNAGRGVGFYTKRLVSAIQSELKTNNIFKNWSLDLIQSPSQSTQQYSLVHYPYFDPFQLTLPPIKNIPTVVTVHDLVPRQYKQYYPVGLRGEIKWLIQKNRLQRVNHIITDSNTAKISISQITGIKTNNISTIYLAADQIFQPTKDMSLLKSVSQKYHLPPKFILYVGDVNWNKNIPALVKSCQQLSYPLIVVGTSAAQKNPPIHPWTSDLRWLQQQAGKNLSLLGFVPDSDLNCLYNLATIYCQPSFAEGFGLSLLEAMQSGCPTVFSQGTSLDEISQNSGLSFKPQNQESLKTSLSQLWNNKLLQTKYRQLGIKRSKQFSWSNTAIQTLDIYNSILK